jgi:hypothetical protein
VAVDDGSAALVGAGEGLEGGVTSADEEGAASDVDGGTVVVVGPAVRPESSEPELPHAATTVAEPNTMQTATVPNLTCAPPSSLRRATTLGGRHPRRLPTSSAARRGDEGRGDAVGARRTHVAGPGHESR